MFRCKSCGEEFTTENQAEHCFNQHPHIRIVRNEPVTYLLELGSGITLEKKEVADIFGELFDELKAKKPDKQFQLIPFTFDREDFNSEYTLTAILAVEQ